MSRRSHERPGSGNPFALTRRDLLKGFLGAGLAAGLPGCSTTQSAKSGNASAQRPDAIARENSQRGTREWLLTNTRIDPATKYRCPWIEGYCSRTSVRAGEEISFHVSTNPPSPFRIDLYRMGYYGGSGARKVDELGPFAGVTQADPPVERLRLRRCRWEACATLRIPADWLSGVYLGKLTAEREGLQSYLIFIVRDDRRADLIFQCSDTTWQSYNRWPNQFSLYDDGEAQWYWGANVGVSFDRPYGKYCQIFDAPLSTGSGEWFLWEFPVAYWLESLGYDVTYISNLDTHADPRGLLRAKGFLSVGHDEYYSIEMFENLKEVIVSGLNVAFLSGNTCCGRIQFLEAPASHSGALRSFERVDAFAPADPEDLKRLPDMARLPHTSPNSNTLVGARNIAPFTGGADYICAAPDHWLFEGTGMKGGDAIPGLVGWEWHGDPAPIPGLVVVATGKTSNRGKPPEGVYTSTIYPGPKGNFVFNASTCWWGDGLSEPPGYVRPSVYTDPQGPDPRVQQMTRNLIGRIQQSAFAGPR